MTLERTHQDDRILKRKAGSGANGEVGRVGRVSQQNAVGVMPALAPKPRELTPDRVVRDQRRPLKHLPEQVLTVGCGLRLVHLVKAVTNIAIGLALDNEGAHLRRVAVVVRIQCPGLVLDEGLTQCLEGPGSAKPGEAVLHHLQPGGKGFGVGFAD